MKRKNPAKRHIAVLCTLYLFGISLALAGCGQDDAAVQEIMEETAPEESESAVETSSPNTLLDSHADIETENSVNQLEQEKEDISADNEVTEDTFDYSSYVGKTWVDASWDWEELYLEQASFYITQIEDGIISGNFKVGLDYPSCNDQRIYIYFGHGNMEADVRNGISKFMISEEGYDASVELHFLEDDQIEVTVQYERMELFDKDNSDGHMDGTFIFRPYNITDMQYEQYSTVEIVEEDAFQVHTDYWEEAYLVPITVTQDIEPRKGQQYSEAYLTDGEGNILLRMEGTILGQEFQDIREEDVDEDGRLDIKMVIIWVPFYPENPIEEIVFRQLENGMYQRYQM